VIMEGVRASPMDSTLLIQVIILWGKVPLALTLNKCQTLAHRAAIKISSFATPAPGESQCDSLQSNPASELHLQTLVSSRRAQTCTDGPSHQKSKNNKACDAGPRFFSGQMCRLHISGGEASASQQQHPLASCVFSLSPSGLLVVGVGVGAQPWPFRESLSLWSGAGGIQKDAILLNILTTLDYPRLVTL
jgi:hypothetical protein